MAFGAVIASFGELGLRGRHSASRLRARSAATSNGAPEVTAGEVFAEIDKLRRILEE